MTAKSIMNVHRGRAFQITIANFGKPDVDLPKYHIVDKFKNALQEIAHIEDEHVSYLSAA